MKKLLLIFLLAGCHPCFAQQVGVNELLRVMETLPPDAVSQYLSPLNYSLVSTDKWSFQLDKQPDEGTVAEIYRGRDTLGTKLVFTTNNSVFYTHVVNQLSINNFPFKQAVPVNDHIILQFSNNIYYFYLESEPIGHLKSYTITLRTVNIYQTGREKQTKFQMPARYDHTN